MNTLYDQIVWNTLNSPAAAAKIAMGTLSQLDRQMNQITRPLVQGARYEDATSRKLDATLQQAMAGGTNEEIRDAFANIGQRQHYLQSQEAAAPTEPVDIEGAIKKQLAALLKEAGFKVPEPKEAK